MTLNDKIVLALAQLLKASDKHITGYKIAKHIGLDTSIVYRQLKQLSQGK